MKIVRKNKEYKEVHSQQYQKTSQLISGYRQRHISTLSATKQAREHREEAVVWKKGIFSLVCGSLTCRA